MSGEPSRRSTRRKFIQVTGAAALLAQHVPTVMTAPKTDPKYPLVGEGEFQYECHHNWGQLPSHIRWGETHGVAVDREGLVYIKHRNRAPEPMDAIAVFDPDGKFVRSFGREYHGGGHGIDIRQENGQEFLYLSDVLHGWVVKADLKGEHVWQKGRPTEPGVYDDPAVKYSPTNVCFGPDGGFYIADGYGSHFIHQYDKDAKWVRTWGGFGDAPGKMKTPHGIWLDNRPGRELTLAVCDRANARLQYFSLDGKHLSFVKDLSFPAHLDIRGDVLLCPDLHARITLLDKNNQVITHLGYSAEWTAKVLAGNNSMRSDPQQWVNGRFVHPHDACFDKDGNVFVAEWVPTGRVSLLRKVS